MTADLFAQHWLVNTLFDDGFIRQKAEELAAKPLPYGLKEWLAAHFDPTSLAERSEAQLEDKFIGPLLTQLGWAKVNQEVITVQGKQAKLNWCQMLGPEHEQALLQTKDHALITAICESKDWDKKLDTGKADRLTNPHRQLQDYLSTLRARFGFLTKGRC